MLLTIAMNLLDAITSSYSLCVLCVMLHVMQVLDDTWEKRNSLKKKNGVVGAPGAFELCLFNGIRSIMGCRRFSQRDFSHRRFPRSFSCLGSIVEAETDQAGGWAIAGRGTR